MSDGDGVQNGIRKIQKALITALAIVGAFFLPNMVIYYGSVGGYPRYIIFPLGLVALVAPLAVGGIFLVVLSE